MRTFRQFINESEAPKEVELTGVLKKTEDGFYYLKIEDQLVFTVIRLLNDPKVQKPPYFKKNAGDVGAHISVILSDEAPINTISEVGQEFRFKWGAIKSVKPDDWDDVQKVYFIEVISKSLEDLREKYGLSRKIKDNQEFHITFAVTRE